MLFVYPLIRVSRGLAPSVLRLSDLNQLFSLSVPFRRKASNIFNFITHETAHGFLEQNHLTRKEDLCPKIHQIDQKIYICTFLGSHYFLTRPTPNTFLASTLSGPPPQLPPTGCLSGCVMSVKYSGWGGRGLSLPETSDLPAERPKRRHGKGNARGWTRQPSSGPSCPPPYLAE